MTTPLPNGGGVACAAARVRAGGGGALEWARSHVCCRVGAARLAVRVVVLPGGQTGSGGPTAKGGHRCRRTAGRNGSGLGWRKRSGWTVARRPDRSEGCQVRDRAVRSGPRLRPDKSLVASERVSGASDRPSSRPDSPGQRGCDARGPPTDAGGRAAFRLGVVRCETGAGAGRARLRGPAVRRGRRRRGLGGRP